MALDVTNDPGRDITYWRRYALHSTSLGLVSLISEQTVAWFLSRMVEVVTISAQRSTRNECGSEKWGELPGDPNDDPGNESGSCRLLNVLL